MQTQKQTSKVVFKPYHQHQISLLPPSLEELIPENHLVRMVNSSIEKMDINPIINEYKGGGTSSYHPKMLLKVIVYAYTQRLYSSRRIAKALRENINYMWLSGNNRPDFRTINRFRSSRLKDTIDEVFSSLIIFLIEEGYVKLENYFYDGTRMEANANKYSFVWSRATKKFKTRLETQIKELIRHIDLVNEEENKQYGEKDLEEMGEESEINEERIEAKITELNERLKEISPGKKKDAEFKADKEITNKDDTKLKERQLREINNKLQNDYLPRYKKYKNYEETLGNRNSFSKTDKDATFMRMKEDHMSSGQLKAGYNLQIGTEGQYILGYSLHQKSTDTEFLRPHIEKLKRLLKRSPKRIIADAGYGSLENYEYLNKEKIESYVKYNQFYREQKRSHKKNKYRLENFKYDIKEDKFSCPEGEILEYKFSRSRKTDNGYDYETKIYESNNCNKCPQKQQCCQGKYNRRIEDNYKLNKYRTKEKEKLLSPFGLELRKQRATDVETVFGQIKGNMGFKRFMLRGIKKVNIETGLISLAHNIKKLFNVKNLETLGNMVVNPT